MSHTSGFSLVELILVLSLIGIAALFSTTYTLNSIGQSAVAEERDLFVSLLLRGARSEALANAHETNHGIHIDTHQYVLFEGTSYSADDSQNKIIPFTSNDITVSNSNGTDILFDQLSGEVSTGAGVVTLSNGEQSKTITIRQTGQIDW